MTGLKASFQTNNSNKQIFLMADLLLTASTEEAEDEEEYINAEFKSVEQISDELITLSLLPNSRWQNLLSLDVIKVT